LIQTVGCKKERKQNIYNVEQYVKDWMFFDTGTWWVYKEMNSGMVDSHYVTKSEFVYTETDQDDKSTPYIKAQSAFVHINKGYFLYLKSPSGRSIVEKVKEGNWGSTILLFKVLEVGQWASSGLGYTEIKEVDPNYTLDNVKFDTMVTLLDNRDASENNDSVEYKVYKGVGIINKKNITRKQEWKLIKYHINLNKQ
jgi:hypothetical protein